MMALETFPFPEGVNPSLERIVQGETEQESLVFAILLYQCYRLTSEVVTNLMIVCKLANFHLLL